MRLWGLGNDAAKSVAKIYGLAEAALRKVGLANAQRSVDGAGEADERAAGESEGVSMRTMRDR